MAEYLTKLDMRLYHYCLMPNHTHLLVSAVDVGLLSRFAHFVHRRYTYHYCRAYGWSEQLFNRRFRSIPIESDGYLLECGRYIERNPLKSNRVQDVGDYPYSSYGFYVVGAASAFITRNPMYDTFGRTEEERRQAYKAYLLTPRPYESLLDETISNYVPVDLVR